MVGDGSGDTGRMQAPCLPSGQRWGPEYLWLGMANDGSLQGLGGGKGLEPEEGSEHSHDSVVQSPHRVAKA